MVEGKGRIEVIDSSLTAMSLGLAVISAAKMAAQKIDAQGNKPSRREKLPRTNTIMAFDTLKFLAKGGRIGKAQGLLGSLLAVKPVLDPERWGGSPVDPLALHGGSCRLPV